MATPLLPPLAWAQRNDVVLLTVQLPDVTEVDVNAIANILHVQCRSGANSYLCDVPLFATIAAEESGFVTRARGISIKLKKAQPAQWPRLASDKKKLSHVQIDWGLWRDEDDDEETTSHGDDPRGLEKFGATSNDEIFKMLSEMREHVQSSSKPLPDEDTKLSVLKDTTNGCPSELSLTEQLQQRKVRDPFLQNAQQEQEEEELRRKQKPCPDNSDDEMPALE